MYDKARIIPGNFTKVGFMLNLNLNEFQKVKHRSLGRIRAKRNGHGDTCKENEGEVYSAGVF